MRLRQWVLNNIGLKFLAVLLSAITWFYIYAELRKGGIEERRAAFSFLKYKVISKKLPVKVILAGELPDDYMIREDGIKVYPPTVHVIGPEILLKDVDFARTMPVDITEYRKPFERDIELAPIAKGIDLQNEIVRIIIPIVKSGE